MRAHRAHLTPGLAARARACHSGLDALGDGNGTLEEIELRAVDPTGALFRRKDTILIEASLRPERVLNPYQSLYMQCRLKR